MASADPISLDAARELSHAVAALPGVAGLHAGAFGEVALLYPRERVRGLRISGDGALEVHIIAALDLTRDLRGLGREVARLAGRFTDLPVDVIVADASSQEE